MLRRISYAVAAGVLALTLVASGCSVHGGYDVGYPTSTYVVYE